MKLDKDELVKCIDEALADGKDSGSAIADALAEKGVVDFEGGEDEAPKDDDYGDKEEKDDKPKSLKEARGGAALFAFKGGKKDDADE